MEEPKDLTTNFIFMVVLCLASVVVDIYEMINGIKSLMILIKPLKELAERLIEREQEIKSEILDLIRRW